MACFISYFVAIVGKKTIVLLNWFTYSFFYIPLKSDTNSIHATKWCEWSSSCLPGSRAVYCILKPFFWTDESDVKDTYKELFADMTSPGSMLPQNVPKLGAHLAGPSYTLTLSFVQPTLRSTLKLKKSSLIICSTIPQSNFFTTCFL